MASTKRNSARVRPSAQSVVDRRIHIIAMTRDLIAEVGIEGITMRHLAQRCGVAVATLYNQFGSRESIIADALREDFEGRYEAFTADMSPSARLEARISKAAAAITGPMGDYTRSVMFFYFHHKPNSELRATIHDFVMTDFSGIVHTIQERNELQPWVNTRTFADDLITQLYSLATKWTQGYISNRQLKPRLIQAAAASFIGISTGASRAEFEALAMRLLANPRAQKR